MYRWSITERPSNDFDGYEAYDDMEEPYVPTIEDQLAEWRDLYYKGAEWYRGYSRGSKKDLNRFLQDRRTNEFRDFYFDRLGDIIWLPYKLVGYNEKAKHTIEVMSAKNLHESIIASQLEKMKLEECVDWAWELDEDELKDSRSTVYDDIDWERQSYLELGGSPERYHDGCLDDYMDSIGL